MNRKTDDNDIKMICGVNYNNNVKVSPIANWNINIVGISIIGLTAKNLLQLGILYCTQTDFEWSDNTIELLVYVM